MLHQKYPSEKVAELLIPREAWHPFPTVPEREPWEALPESVRDGYVADGEEAQGREWPVLLAERYLDFARDGNRSRYEGVYFARRGMLGSLVIAECMEGKGRFLDAIANGIWLICEESSWCVPAHINAQKVGSGLPDTTEPIVDLFAAETSALLSWTDYLLGDKLDSVSPLIRPRVLREIKARILNPCWSVTISGGWASTLAILTAPQPRQQLEPLDQLELARHRAADGGRSAAAVGAHRQEHAQRRPFRRSLPGRWRLRRRSQLLGARGRVAAGLPGAAPQRHAMAAWTSMTSRWCRISASTSIGRRSPTTISSTLPTPRPC